MKKFILIGLGAFLAFFADAQSTTATNVQTIGQSNFLGYTNNYPLLSKTAATNRMKLNGNINYALNGYNASRNGNLLIGISNNSINSGQNIFTGNTGAFSLLHINGPGSGFQEFGYRPWMQTGVTFTGNRDLSYFGLRKVGTGEDITETTITWSDNNAGNTGPDDMVFRFTGAGNGNTSISTNLTNNGDLDGLHIARFAPTGEFGLGNTFGVNASGTPANLYVRPASLAHYSLSNYRSVWQQFTNRNTAIGSGTGETANDGLRIGIVGNYNSNINGTAVLYNQETRALLFSTNANTNTMNIATGATNERMRLMSVGTPTNLASGGFGIYNPAGLNTNFTRMAISHNPNNPITRPLSLLHLGYNAGAGTPIIATTDGWRKWMDIGIFTSNGTDNMYMGLKNEGSADRNDAVINWGDNQGYGGGQGPDKLRFIFTSTTTSIQNPGDPISTSANGLETMRIVPFKDTTYIKKDSLGVIISQKDIYGRVGIGDFTSQGVNQEPTHKLDVVGNGRFRYLPDSLNIADSSVTKYVMVDSLGVLRWTDAAPGGIGVACGDSINGKLIIDRHIDLNNNNFYFTNNDSIGQNHVGIGLPCASPLQGKLTVYQSHPKLITAVNPLTIAGLFVNTDSSQVGGTQFYGAIGYAVGNNMVKGSENTGGRFLAQNSYRSTGVRGMAISGDYNQGGHFEASGANYGNVGVYAKATASLNGSAGDAGIFEGNVTVYGDLTVSGAFNNPSDSMLKQNVMPLKHSDSLLNLLNPVTYNYKVNDFQQLHLDSTGQMGLIAQEVEPIFANVVHITTTLPVFDSLGNIITPAFTYKTLDYTKFIPVLIAGHQEQNSKIDSLQTSNDSLQLTVDSLIIVNNNQDSLINDLNNRLSHLENCLSGILPILCQMSHQSIQTNSPEVQQAIRSQLEVYLQNKEAIILDQNVPNPFAEQTVINFTIPESVKSAQIFFYDGMGKLIKTVDIRERGLGSITVFGSDLSSGTYMYTLVADGVNVATKKMVKE